MTKKKLPLLKFGLMLTGTLSVLFWNYASAADDTPSRAPVDATTSDGKRVTLNEDGTWHLKTLEPKTSKHSVEVFRKSDLATTRYLNHLGFEVWVDRHLWSPSTPAGAGANEIIFEHRNGEAWCKVTAERIPIPREELVQFETEGLRPQSGELIQQSDGSINSVGGYVLDYKATLRGINWILHTFVGSTDRGTVEIMCWTSAKLTNEYRPAFNSFFGGFAFVATSK